MGRPITGIVALIAAGVVLVAPVTYAKEKHPDGATAARLLDIKWKDGPLPGSTIGAPHPRAAGRLHPMQSGKGVFS